MTQNELNKAIKKLAEIMEVSTERVMQDLREKNSMRWYMIEELVRKCK